MDSCPDTEPKFIPYALVCLKVTASSGFARVRRRQKVAYVFISVSIYSSKIMLLSCSLWPRKTDNQTDTHVDFTILNMSRYLFYFFFLSSVSPPMDNRNTSGVKSTMWAFILLIERSVPLIFRRNIKHTQLYAGSSVKP